MHVKMVMHVLRQTEIYSGSLGPKIQTPRGILSEVRRIEFLKKKTARSLKANIGPKTDRNMEQT
jgi:hypothetical protein